MKIPFFNYSYVFESQKESLLNIIVHTSQRGAFIMQKELQLFENNLAKYTNTQFCVGVANATDGLQIALLAGGIRKDDEIIFCSHTMVATASAIHFAGAIPIPIEAGDDHLIDTSSIEKSITTKTKAIVPTQLNGRTSNMDEIQMIADKHNLMIFEDAAQSLGSKFKGKNAGTFGKASCISFYPAKILGCLGDGGAVLTDDSEIYDKLLLLRDHGRTESGNVVLWGFNSRLDNIQAAILDYKLKFHDQVIARRRKIALQYQQLLGKIEQLVLPPPPDSDHNHFDIYQNYEIEAERRDELKVYLFENGIGTIIQWGGKAVHQFSDLGFTQSLPFTEELFKKILLLPINMSLSDNDINYICDRIIQFYN